MMAYGRTALWPAGSGTSRAQWATGIRWQAPGRGFASLGCGGQAGTRTPATAIDIEKMKNAVAGRRTSAPVSSLSLCPCERA